MCLLDLIEEDDRVRLATNSLRQLPSFVVAYVSRRSTDETSGGELLLIFTHINTGEHRLVIKEHLGKSLGKLRLPHTCSSEEEEGAYRTLGILKACTRATNSIGHSLYS